MTSVKKISQRGLAAAAIMLALVLGFYSLAGAATRTVSIPCGQDIDATINADSKSTATRFVLGAGCTFTASATIAPSEGDEVACAAAPTFVRRGPAFDPEPKCAVAGPGVLSVFRPMGPGGSEATVRFEGIRITGGVYSSKTGSGTGVAMGSAADDSSMYAVEVMNNEAAGILSGRGTFDRIELTNNTTNSQALGINAAGMKSRHEVEVKNSYVHDTQGNGLWCDNECYDSSVGKYWIHGNLVVNAGRGGIRWEEVSQGEALIEDNWVHGNSRNASRGGISVRDAKDALIQRNVFGAATIAGVSYSQNADKVPIMASDSGLSDRPNLDNIDIVNNTLNGEIIKGCELRDTVVACSRNTP